VLGVCKAFIDVEQKVFIEQNNSIIILFGDVIGECYNVLVSNTRGKIDSKSRWHSWEV